MDDIFSHSHMTVCVCVCVRVCVCACVCVRVCVTFCDHFTDVCTLHLWYMMMLAVYMAIYIYKRYPNIQYMCMYRACSLVRPLMATL